MGSKRAVPGLFLVLGGVCACGPDAESPVGVKPYDFPDPAAWGATTGPGGPARAFSADELGEACGYVVGGPGDSEHHNLVVINDGYLVHPWAPEYGGGGVSFLDVTDPCAPEVVGQAWSDLMRESHTLAFGEAGGRSYLAVDYHESLEVGGVGIWDITDPSAPVWVSQLATPGYHYPDSYLRVTFSNFWLGDVLYVSAAFNGLHVVDASDPLDLKLVNTVTFEGLPHLVGSFTVIGDVGFAASAGTSRAVLMDVSDPWNPVPIPGGDFHTEGAEGTEVEYYFSSIGGKYAIFARKDAGGGPLLYDLTDPAAPVKTGEHFTPDGDGGYVYRQSDRLFMGDSNFASVYDFDPVAPTEIFRFEGPGDLDTLSPVGNVAVLSVDSGGAPGEASAVIPVAEQPDVEPPRVELARPAEGAIWVPVTSPIGVSFDEWVEHASVFEGSFRVVDAEGQRVPGRFNTQESVVNFTADSPLREDTTYTVTLPAGGITDVSGNPTASDHSWSFSTGPGAP